MAQSAVAAIRTGCNMLAEGKAEIDKFKKTVEKGVGDAKAIYKEVTGIWSWLQSLFTIKQAKPRELVLPVVDKEVTKIAAKTSKQRKEPEIELTYEEFQARQVHEICENLKVYFEAIRALKAHCRELEEQSLTTEKVADSAIDRIELEWQMKQLAVQVKEAMIYTPERLGLQALYSRFWRCTTRFLRNRNLLVQLNQRKSVTQDGNKTCCEATESTGELQRWR